MNNPVRAAAARAGTALGILVQVAFYILTPWGIYWSFHRHGAGQGVVSIFVPPFAWYRGVAAIWEKPEWKETWDENAEALGYLLEGVWESSDSERAIKLAKAKSPLKSWIKNLPDRQRADLRPATENYANAVSQVMRNAINDTADGVPMRPPSDPSVAVFVSRFKAVPGLLSAWNRLQADISPLGAQWQKTMAESEPADQVRRFRDKQIGLQFVEARSALMASTIEELFRK